MKFLFYRIFQTIMYLGSFFLPWRQPKLLSGRQPMEELAATLSALQLRCVLVVTDAGLMKLGLLEAMFVALDKREIKYVVYADVVPNPTIDNIEEGFELYKKNQCCGIIAFGGGSPMDCAKVIGARVAKPHKTVAQMKGLFKILKKTPPFFAVPTTSGTGSETTLAAVVSDAQTHCKYAISDLVLIPDYAVLDASLTLQLPAHITSTTGMDALCHAVEAYIGRANTQATVQAAQKAIVLIKQFLLLAYRDGSDVEARQQMQHAAYLAGLAFTRAYVGAIHAIAHALGGAYQTPHGLANAVIMPYVLRYYGQSAVPKLAELADLIQISEGDDCDSRKAEKFIQWIEGLNQQMNIPKHLPEILEQDIDGLAHSAVAEANPLYPLPKILFKEDYVFLLNKIKQEG